MNESILRSVDVIKNKLKLVDNQVFELLLLAEEISKELKTGDDK